MLLFGRSKRSDTSRQRFGRMCKSICISLAISSTSKKKATRTTKKALFACKQHFAASSSVRFGNDCIFSRVSYGTVASLDMHKVYVRSVLLRCVPYVDDTFLCQLGLIVPFSTCVVHNLCCAQLSEFATLWAVAWLPVGIFSIESFLSPSPWICLAHRRSSQYAVNQPTRGMCRCQKTRFPRARETLGISSRAVLRHCSEVLKQICDLRGRMLRVLGASLKGCLVIAKTYVSPALHYRLMSRVTQIHMTTRSHQRVWTKRQRSKRSVTWRCHYVIHQSTSTGSSQETTASSCRSQPMDIIIFILRRSVIWTKWKMTICPHHNECLLRAGNEVCTANIWIHVVLCFGCFFDYHGGNRIRAIRLPPF